jgi:endonuclease YncB( thermonuclease family)
MLLACRRAAQITSGQDQRTGILPYWCRIADLQLKLTRGRASAVTLRAAFLAALAAFCGSAALAAEQPQPAPACGGAEIERATATRVIDGRTFALGDGREVRLAAIEAPGLDPQQPDGNEAKEALAKLIEGTQIVLRTAEIKLDRYGRIVAYAYVQRDGSDRLVQGELVAAGAARVGSRIGKRECVSELLRRENAARQAKLGLWANSYYEALDADHPADVLAQRGRFALVEGTVVSVRESGATIYVNFGRRWSEAFAVTVLKRNERSFKAAGLDLKKLMGQRVRVRGYVEERGGDGIGLRGSPWIEAANPGQIELADRK